MRFYLIDALRGLAAMWVVLFHAYEGKHIEDLAESLPQFLTNVLFAMGEVGVPIFFVISGFVIAHSISRDDVNGKYLFKFALRRSVRLDPPYWLSIVLVLGMAWLSAIVKSEPMEWPSNQVIVAHLFYLQGILDMKHINTVYWTLCLEIQFYLVFISLFLLAKHIDKSHHDGLGIVFFMAAIVSLLWPLQIMVDNIHPGLFFPHWHAFLVGVFAYWSWKKIIRAHYFYIYAGIIIFSSYVTKSDFSMAAGLTAIFIHVFSISGRIGIANWRWIQFLGAISYSLYLTHNPIAGASFFVTYRLMGNSLIAQYVALFVTIIACIIFASIFWWLAERWSMRLSKRVIIHNRT